MIGCTGSGISISEASEGPRKSLHGFSKVGMAVGVAVEVAKAVGVLAGSFSSCVEVAEGGC
jgi:hypothetical protein